MKITRERGEEDQRDTGASVATTPETHVSGYLLQYQTTVP